jgi:hypothetical protein
VPITSMSPLILHVVTFPAAQRAKGAVSVGGAKGPVMSAKDWRMSDRLRLKIRRR